MIVERVARVVFVVALAGCVQQPQGHGAVASRHEQAAAIQRQAARAKVAESAHRLELLLGQKPEASASLDAFSSLRIVGMDEGPVPDFELLAPGGAQYSSKALVGQQPFVIVFFAT